MYSELRPPVVEGEIWFSVIIFCRVKQISAERTDRGKTAVKWRGPAK